MDGDKLIGDTGSKFDRSITLSIYFYQLHYHQALMTDFWDSSGMPTKTCQIDDRNLRMTKIDDTGSKLEKQKKQQDLYHHYDF